MQLELGKNALVVGGASGIGLATARQFSGEGCQVAVWDIAECVLDQGNASVQHEYFQVDVCDKLAVAQALEATVSRLGGPSITLCLPSLSDQASLELRLPVCHSKTGHKCWMSMFLDWRMWQVLCPET